MAGSMSNQRYEAEHHISRHLKVVSEAEATRETSRWREASVGNAQIYGQDEKKLRKLHLKNLSLEHENEQLAERIHTIMTEARQDATIEYTPGWRIGKVGTVIDCYISKKNDAEKFSSMHGRSIDAERAERKMQNTNMKLYESIQRARSAYAVEECTKHYEHNRHLARVLNNKVSHTSLHLGLVKAAKEKEKKKKMNLARRASGRPSSGTTTAVAGSAGRAGGLVSSDSAISSFRYSAAERQGDTGPASAALAITSSDSRQYAVARPNTTQATGTASTTISYNNASSSIPTTLAVAAETIGLKKNSRLAVEARDNAATQTRLQQEYPVSYVYASSMGGIIDRASVKPFTAPSSSSPKSTFPPTLLAPESLSASIAGDLWQSFNRIGSVGPAVQEPPVRPKTSAGSAGSATNSSSIVRMDDWGQGAINGGWEKGLVPLIRLGERSSDRLDQRLSDTRNVYLRKFPSEGRPGTAGGSGSGWALGPGSGTGPGATGKPYRDRAQKAHRRLPAPGSPFASNNGPEEGHSLVPATDAAKRQPYCPELINVDTSGPGIGSMSDTSALEGVSVDDGSVTVLPPDAAGLHAVNDGANTTSVHARAGAIAGQSSVLRGSSPSYTTSLQRNAPPSPAQLRTEGRRAKKREEGWTDDIFGKHLAYNRRTVDVSVKGGRMRIAESLFAPT